MFSCAANSGFLFVLPLRLLLLRQGRAGSAADAAGTGLSQSSLADSEHAFTSRPPLLFREGTVAALRQNKADAASLSMGEEARVLLAGQ